jgi:hypothetical protein
MFQYDNIECVFEEVVHPAAPAQCHEFSGSVGRYDGSTITHICWRKIKGAPMNGSIWLNRLFKGNWYDAQVAADSCDIAWCLRIMDANGFKFEHSGHRCDDLEITIRRFLQRRVA